MRLRVAHVTHSLDAGGTERRLLAVAAGLDRDRFESLVVCLDGLGSLADEARAAGLDPVVLGRSWRFDPSGIARLRRLLRRERVDVVHGWMWLPGVFARVAGATGGAAVRVVGEGGAIATTRGGRARALAVSDRLLAPLTDAWVANSDAVAESLRARRLPPEKIVVIRNGVAPLEPLPADERARLRAELGAGPGDRLVGMVARLDPDFKDHQTYLAAVAALAAEGLRVRGAVIGDGPGRGAVERQASAFGIADRVVFTGFRRDSARLVAALDVSVLLTYSEGFSNVVLESMAAGVPLVATDIAPNREAVEDGVHGALVPVRDAPATTRALRAILDDSDLAATLAAAARARASERFSLKAQADATMELYDRLTAARRG